jgi:hypothetical protein
MLVYKVVETSTVTDEELERLLNEWVPQGWTLDGIRFVVRESSRRPAMAFVTFTREQPEPSEPSAATAARRKKIP